MGSDSQDSPGRAGPLTRLVAASLLLLPAALLGHGTPAAAVADGQDAPLGRYGFAVKLTMTGLPTVGGGRRDSSCTGALIAPQWVITAGHCFKNAKGTRVGRPVARRTTVTAGRTDLTDTSAGQESTVVAVRQSPATDVALARIDPPITDVTPIRLSRSRPSVGDRVRLAGFGYIRDDDESSLATRLQTGQFEVVSVSRPYLGMAGRAPKRTTSPCSHDSGGPYFSQETGGQPALVAVVSNGPDCPHSGADSSGRVDNIAGWITGITGPVPAATASAPPAPVKTAATPSSTTAPAAAAPEPAGGFALQAAVVAVVVAGFGTPALLLAGRVRRRGTAQPGGVRRHRR